MAKVFLSILRKQGVRLGSTLDSELRYMGITPKSLPCVIRKNGLLGDVDNLPAEEFNEYPVVSNEDDNGYINRQYVLDCIRNEFNGIDTLNFEQLHEQYYSDLENE